MATVNDKQKQTAELILDVITVAVAVDVTWVFFFKQTPPIDFLHDWIAVLGTGAVGWLVWKMARKNKAF